MKALVIGATGATGKELVNLLLEDTYFSQVHIFVRREMDIHHTKLHTHIVDFNQPQSWQDLIKGDVAFSCLGTTIQIAKTKENQWKVDYTYQYEFAQNARKNNVEKYILVSSQMADAKSFNFYTKMKGKLEDAVKQLNFKHTIIFQPGILERYNSDRMGEKLGIKVIKFLNKLGLFKSQRPMPTRTLAQAMINISKSKNKTLKIITTDKIFDIAQNKTPA